MIIGKVYFNFYCLYDFTHMLIIFYSLFRLAFYVFTAFSYIILPFVLIQQYLYSHHGKKPSDLLLSVVVRLSCSCRVLYICLSHLHIDNALIHASLMILMGLDNISRHNMARLWC